MAVGFNSARLHQKIFEELFHYWADKLGYLTPGEFNDFGMEWKNAQCILNHPREWQEIVKGILTIPQSLCGHHST